MAHDRSETPRISNRLWFLLKFPRTRCSPRQVIIRHRKDSAWLIIFADFSKYDTTRFATKRESRTNSIHDVHDIKMTVCILTFRPHITETWPLGKNKKYCATIDTSSQGSGFRRTCLFQCSLCRNVIVLRRKKDLYNT